MQGAHQEPFSLQTGRFIFLLLKQRVIKHDELTTMLKK